LWTSTTIYLGLFAPNKEQALFFIALLETAWACNRTFSQLSQPWHVTVSQEEAKTYA
jgi:hypothetical protein